MKSPFHAEPIHILSSIHFYSPVDIEISEATYKIIPYGLFFLLILVAYINVRPKNKQLLVFSLPFKLILFGMLSSIIVAYYEWGQPLLIG